LEQQPPALRIRRTLRLEQPGIFAARIGRQHSVCGAHGEIDVTGRQRLPATRKQRLDAIRSVRHVGIGSGGSRPATHRHSAATQAIAKQVKRK